ncbi:hypothetical protein VNI00_000607 [Paramarasmius palmivorus]|uniref:Uncharacterized protein n=1 Tax=Paramarasmius palmivorus TaxID=297713 RepID=A0AAW0EA49_9AGAR
MFTLITVATYLFFALILFVSTLYLVCKLSLAFCDWRAKTASFNLKNDPEANLYSIKPPGLSGNTRKSPTPRYAPHPSRCACPVHVRSKSFKHLESFQPQKVYDSETAVLRNDLSRLFLPSPKVLSSAHSTIIRRSSSSSSFEYKLIENVHNTPVPRSPPPSPVERKGVWRCLDERKKYDGGYKKGVYKAAFRRSQMKSSESGSSLTSSSSGSTSSSIAASRSCPPPSATPSFIPISLPHSQSARRAQVAASRSPARSNENMPPSSLRKNLKSPTPTRPVPLSPNAGKEKENGAALYSGKGRGRGKGGVLRVVNT